MNKPARHPLYGYLVAAIAAALTVLAAANAERGPIPAPSMTSQATTTNLSHEEPGSSLFPHEAVLPPGTRGQCSQTCASCVLDSQCPNAFGVKQYCVPACW